MAPEMVILNEAQRIKNWNTIAARALKRIDSAYAFVLTGTPLENKLEELVSIVQFVDQHRLGPTWKLLHEHQVKDEFGRVTGYTRLEKIGQTPGSKLAIMTMVINLRNAFQLFVSADRRYGPVYNLGIVGSDAYNGDNTSPITAVSTGTTSNISISAKKFPLASGSSRFHVIPASEKIVAYVCSGGQLLRSVNHAYSNSCPTAVSIGGSSVAVMANNVATCNFVYNGSDLQRNGLVQFGLTLTQSGESVRLYHEVHVSNTP